MRPVLYVSIVAMLAILGFVAWNEARNFEQQFAEKQRKDLVNVLASQVGAIVGSFGTDLAAILRAMGESEDPDALNARLRRRVPWYDTAYVWRADRLIWPPEPFYAEADVLRAEPCLAAAAEVTGDTEPLVTAYLRCTAVENDAVRLLAVSEAAEVLLNADEADDAEAIIRRSEYWRLPIRLAADRGISPTQLLLLRYQLSRAWVDMGRGEEARRLLSASLTEVMGLEGPYLESTLRTVEGGLAREVARLGGTPRLGEDDVPYARAQRRLTAWRELQTRGWARSPLGLPTLPTLYSDPYADPPWLVYMARLEDGTVTAVQVDQDELVEWAWSRVFENLAPWVSIRDATGHVLAGSDGPIAEQVSFGWVAPRLRIAASQTLLQNDGAARRALLGHLAPIAFTIVIGLMALAGMISTDRRQQRLLAQQREFVARVTHELKTPIAGIQLMAENLEMGAFKGDEGRVKFARQIIKEAERLTRRVDEVLRAAREPVDEVESGVDLAQVCREIAERWRPLFEQRGATLGVDVPEQVPARVKVAVVRDALTNLVDNALKYGREDRPLRVILSLRAERRWLVFEVVDNGMGVPPAMRKRIFERFARVEGPGRGKAGGHGLGLAFVADAAAAHGGKVDCREGIDGGARFTFRIRRKK